MMKQYYMVRVDKKQPDEIPLGRWEGQNFFFYNAWGSTISEVFDKVTRLEDNGYILVSYALVGWEGLSSQELLEQILFSDKKPVYQFVEGNLLLETLVHDAMKAVV